ncbi:hypothetical protein KVR01_012066 [Diaporthe batatas]|uniref:uncharacterized protein n=1 Tax=Diaporthe batatas TaxID=748121 RepID=UPI001D04B0BC|nr:uncharacterized protein KVR01_012066 [Diaporthe batatas]KAG8158305.1 hypothetical protein KVR01_012066 [Diaporthe batatas]
MVSWDPHFTPRVTDPNWPNDREIPQVVTPVEPLYEFNMETFFKRHSIGTQNEFLLEKEEIEAFNTQRHSFKAWPIFYIRQMVNSAVLLFFVEPSGHDSMLPKEGENCDISIPGFNSKSPATRVDNPCSLWRVRNELWEKCSAFHVHLTGKDNIMAKFPRLQLAQGRRSIPPISQLETLRVSFKLRVSTSTRNAELGALWSLDQGVKGHGDGHSPWQIEAYKYFVLLGHPTGHMPLFSLFPHMLDAFVRPDSIPPQLLRLFQTLNDQQQHAFQQLLREIPNGICVVHGCPGAGKTHWNLVVAAALQSKDEITYPGRESPEPRKNKVLYLIDINRPLTDAANKMARLYDDLELTKTSEIDGSTVPRTAIRMHCWSYEKLTPRRRQLEAQWEELNHRMSQIEPAEGNQQGSGGQQNSGRGPLQEYDAQADDSERLQIHRFAPAFNIAEAESRNRPDQQSERVAPSLDEAALALYEKHKDTTYRRLQGIRRRLQRLGSTDLEELENEELETLYRDTLMDADMVFTTPVSASKFSSSLFSPTLVIFDESPHARELSNLIAVAKFNPAAWIFSGDVRQTKPFVGSLAHGPCRNQFGPQLQVSMMARADLRFPGAESLNMNHRAYGGLQQLASAAIYNNRMLPANDPAAPGGLPRSTIHLRNRYIMPMKHNQGSQVSRLLVSLREPGAARKADDKSWCHPGHQRWVMDLVLKLLRDDDFKQTSGAGQGTILIMAPYTAAFRRYRKAITDLRIRHPAFKDRVVEARTIDSAQGHEADVVILDFVRQRPTDFLEDRSRLCVGLTRARQAEFLLMHPDLVRAVEGGRRSCLKNVVALCKGAGEFVSDPAPLPEVVRRPVRREPAPRRAEVVIVPSPPGRGGAFDFSGILLSLLDPGRGSSGADAFSPRLLQEEWARLLARRASGSAQAPLRVQRDSAATRVAGRE